MQMQVTIWSSRDDPGHPVNPNPTTFYVSLCLMAALSQLSRSSPATESQEVDAAHTEMTPVRNTP